ncbi:hypothetical protein KCU88_g216, partial [Aureobasidium melanogenum]
MDNRQLAPSSNTVVSSRLFAPARAKTPARGDANLKTQTHRFFLNPSEPPKSSVVQTCHPYIFYCPHFSTKSPNKSWSSIPRGTIFLDSNPFSNSTRLSNFFFVSTTACGSTLIVSKKQMVHKTHFSYLAFFDNLCLQDHLNGLLSARGSWRKGIRLL